MDFFGGLLIFLFFFRFHSILPLLGFNLISFLTSALSLLFYYCLLEPRGGHLPDIPSIIIFLLSLLRDFVYFNISFLYILLSLLFYLFLICFFCCSCFWFLVQQLSFSTSIKHNQTGPNGPRSDHLETPIGLEWMPFEYPWI